VNLTPAGWLPVGVRVSRYAPGLCFFLERRRPESKPVTSSSRAVKRNLLDWAELQAARAVSVYRPLFEPGGGV
jgi:hypothetical protein